MNKIVQQKRLGDLFTFKNGRAFKKEEWVESGLPIIRIQNLNSSTAQFNYFAGEYSTDISVEAGDLLFSWSGTVGSSFGSHIWQGQSGVLNQHIFKVGLQDSIDKRYAFYGLRYITEAIERSVSGAVGLVHITKERLNEFKLPVPELDEQQRIVAILDQAFEGIAKARANAEQNLQNARALFESHLQSVFAQRGDGWILRPLSEISKVLSGYSFKSSDFSSSNQIKTIKITNVGVKEFVDDFDSLLPSSYQNKYEAFTVKSGSIVIALTRTIIQSGLKVAIVPSEYNGALLNQRVAAITANSEYALDSFVYLYLSTKQVEEYVKSHVNTLMQPNLSVNDLKALPIPLPTIAEQSKMVAAVETLSKETQRLEALYERKIACLDELKKSLLQQAFAGEL